MTSFVSFLKTKSSGVLLIVCLHDSRATNTGQNVRHLKYK